MLESDQPSLADDGHPIAESLHLTQVVGREEDGPSCGAFLAHQVHEDDLHQWVETHARFVQDEQRRLVHQGLDQADLLAVPLR